MANEYGSTAQLKAWLGIEDAADDAVLSISLEAASRQIDEVVGRRFYAATEARQFSPLAADRIFVDDLTSVTTLKTDADADGTYETTWATTDYVLEPTNAADLGRPYTSVRVATYGTYGFPVWPSSVEITGTWGYPVAVPAPIVQATLIQAARLFRRKDAPFGVAGSGDLGEVRLIPGGDLGLDRDAEALVKPYRRFMLAGF